MRGKTVVSRGIVTLALGAMLATAAAAPKARVTRKAGPKRDYAKEHAAIVNRAQFIVSWNAFSPQFTDAPVFKLLPHPKAALYRATVKQDGAAMVVESRTPILDLAGIWPKVQIKPFELTLECLDSKGRALASDTNSRVKAPAWQGMKEPPADWAASADRNIAFLLDAGENHPTTYREPGVPVWVWNAISPGETGKAMGKAIGYPALHMPLMIQAFVANVESKRAQRKESARIARVCGDWLLAHRQSPDSALPLFPYSTICEGKFSGGNEGEAVNLLRASHMAIGLVRLYELTKETKYLDYAGHIADVTMKFQQPDGSFPYRLNPKTGAVVERYTCHGSEFVALVDALAPHRFDAARARAARRAVDWLLAYPAQTGHWQSGYEDVGENIPYQNMENWAALYLIRHLCRHAGEDPSYVPAAEKIMRYVEDQFAAFGADGVMDATAHFPTPMMREQYGCYSPMEVHTGNWILALIELHKASKNPMYLEKAQAAGNAITKSQYKNGEYSTWGKDQTQPTTAYGNWYGCNAWAAEALYKLADYVKTQKR